jgi:hypothetical protein
MHSNKHKTFDIFDYLARDTAKRPNPNMDGNATNRAQGMRAAFTLLERVAAGPAVRQTEEVLTIQSEPADGSAARFDTYCSLLARAVSELPNNTPEARHALYDRSHALYDRSEVAFAGELRENVELSEAQIARERADFERAIRSVERTKRKKKQLTTNDEARASLGIAIASNLLWALSAILEYNSQARGSPGHVIGAGNASAGNPSDRLTPNPLGSFESSPP